MGRCFVNPARSGEIVWGKAMALCCSPHLTHPLFWRGGPRAQLVCASEVGSESKKDQAPFRDSRGPPVVLANSEFSNLSCVSQPESGRSTPEGTFAVQCDARPCGDSAARISGMPRHACVLGSGSRLNFLLHTCSRAWRETAFKRVEPTFG